MSRAPLIDRKAYVQAIFTELSEQAAAYQSKLTELYTLRGRLQTRRISLRAIKAKYPDVYAAVAASRPDSEYLP
jgi:hypothetical protein